MQSSTMTMSSPTYMDFNGLNTMRAEARVDPQASLKQVAKQFEGIFIQMMLKSMRDASMGDAIFDSDQSKLYRDMFDKQVALDMASSKGIGIADSLVRQLGKKTLEMASLEKFELPKNQRQNNSSETLTNGKMLPHSLQRLNTVDQTSVRELSSFELPGLKSIPDKTNFNSPEEFTHHILPYAQKAAKELGVSPLVLISQAALETGWGKSVARHQDGTSSFNLFNIKANKHWDGERVTKSTLEYDNGLAKHERASFRSYDSYADSFADYVNFLKSNNRYGFALHNQGNDHSFIKNIHKAGYATDPNYANKVIEIMMRETIQVHAKTKADSDTDENNMNLGGLNV